MLWADIADVYINAPTRINRTLWRRFNGNGGRWENDRMGRAQIAQSKIDTVTWINRRISTRHWTATDFQ
jgi:hypothetical protein